MMMYGMYEIVIVIMCTLVIDIYIHILILLFPSIQIIYATFNIAKSSLIHIHNIYCVFYINDISICSLTQ